MAEHLDSGLGSDPKRDLIIRGIYLNTNILALPAQKPVFRGEKAIFPARLAKQTPHTRNTIDLLPIGPKQ